MTSSERETLLLNDVKAFVSSHCLLSNTAEAYAASDDKERFLTDLLTKTLANAKYGKRFETGDTVKEIDGIPWDPHREYLELKVKTYPYFETDMVELLNKDGKTVTRMPQAHAVLLFQRTKRSTDPLPATVQLANNALAAARSGSVTIEETPPPYEPTIVDDAVADTTEEAADAVENRKRSAETHNTLTSEELSTVTGVCDEVTYHVGFVHYPGKTTEIVDGDLRPFVSMIGTQDELRYFPKESREYKLSQDSKDTSISRLNSYTEHHVKRKLKKLPGCKLVLIKSMTSKTVEPFVPADGEDALENRKRSVEEVDGDSAAQQEVKKSKPTRPPTRLPTENLPMPRTTIKNCDTEIETVGKYDDDADFVDTYGQEELKALCERLCSGDEDYWRSLHVLTQADLYNYVFNYFCVKWTDLKCTCTCEDKTTSGYKVDRVHLAENNFDRQLWDNVLVDLADTSRTDKRTLALRECFRQDKMKLTNVSLRLLDTALSLPLPDTEFILGPHNKDEVTLRFFEHC